MSGWPPALQDYAPAASDDASASTQFMCQGASVTECGSMLGNQQGPTNRCLQFAKALSLRALQIA
ncbi:hypothetical protein ABTM32_22675, partial [Acinetobacter baumannii]